MAMMAYPTLEQVENADRVQLAKWYRFLPSPGMAAIDSPNFIDILEHEEKVIGRIIERFYALGGMTPEISKLIGV